MKCGFPILVKSVIQILYVQTAVTELSGANCWYWPNPGTEANVTLHNIIHGVEQLTCCVNTPGAPGPCCDSTYPNLCLCDDIVTRQDFLDCLGKAIPILKSTSTQRALSKTTVNCCWWPQDLPAQQILRPTVFSSMRKLSGAIPTLFHGAATFLFNPGTCFPYQRRPPLALE